VLTLACSGPAAVLAQQAPDAGTLLNQQPRPVPQAPPPGANEALPAQPVQPAQPTQPVGKTFVLHSIHLVGNDTIPADELLPLVNDRIGQSVSLDDLNAMAARITQAYRTRGYVLAQALIPPQDVTAGDVTFTILEGKVGHVFLDIASGTPIRESVIRARLAAIKPGQPLRQDTLERTMLLLSDLPGIRVNSSIEAGTEPGTTDLRVTVERSSRVEFALSADNWGSDPAGRYRLGAVGRINSPFMIGDNLDMNLLGSIRGDTLYGRVGYDAPVNNAGTRVGIAYSHLYYNLGQQFAALGAHGEADVVTASISHPLIRSRSQNLLLRGSLEYRSLDDKIGSTSTDSPQKLELATVGLSYESRDSFLGGGFNSAELGLSVAHLRIDSALEKSLDQGPGGRDTQGNSVRMTMLANRLNAITDRWSVFAGISGQWANQNLDSSSRITLGGPRGVRAYSPDEAVVDEGLLGTAAIRFAVRPTLTVSAFFDIGVGRYNARSIAGQGANTVTRSGAGLALYWAGPGGITVDTSLAWRTTRSDSTGDDKVPRLYVQLTKAF